ncbi:MAG: isopenicillin N synthase family dioxygenase [Thiolinea sp.]
MQDEARTDLKESFIWGYQDDQGNTPEDHPLRGQNQWPDQPANMEAAAMAYFREADTVARHLLRGFALGLELSDNFFLQTCTQPMHRAAYVYYPAQDEALGTEFFGVGPHTDFGVLTVLCQDDVGGLQVQTAAGDWIHAPPIEGTLLVNVGDLLHRWTDGAYKSTPHRVVNRSGRERLSLVLAFDPDPQTLIDAREIYGADFMAQQPAITCGDYLIWRFGKAFSYRKQ